MSKDNIVPQFGETWRFAEDGGAYLWTIEGEIFSVTQYNPDGPVTVTIGDVNNNFTIELDEEITGVRLKHKETPAPPDGSVYEAYLDGFGKWLTVYVRHGYHEILATNQSYEWANRPWSKIKMLREGYAK